MLEEHTFLTGLVYHVETPPFSLAPLPYMGIFRGNLLYFRFYNGCLREKISKYSQNFWSKARQISFHRQLFTDQSENVALPAGCMNQSEPVRRVIVKRIQRRTVQRL